MLFDKQAILTEAKCLALPREKFMFAGGATLAVRSIRSTKDLDILVLPELFEEMSCDDNGWELDAEYERKWRRKRLKKGSVELYPDFFLERRNEFLDVAKLIASAEIIEGFRFQSLEHLMMCKLDTAREKDLKDVELIKAYLNNVNAS